MKLLNQVLLIILFVLSVLGASPGKAQTKTQNTDSKAATSPEADAQKKNIQAYVDLLRSDVRQQKAENIKEYARTYNQMTDEKADQ